jgi:hypothetical protein
MFVTKMKKDSLGMPLSFLSSLDECTPSQLQNLGTHRGSLEEVKT